MDRVGIRWSLCRGYWRAPLYNTDNLCEGDSLILLRTLQTCFGDNRY